MVCPPTRTRQVLDPAIGQEWVASLADMFPNVAVSEKEPANLTRSIGVREIARVYDEFMELLEATIDRIHESAGA